MKNFIKQNWFKVVIVIVVAALFSYYFGISLGKQQQSTSLNTTHTELSSTQTASDSNLLNQRDCENQAKKYFKDHYSTMDSYINHYNIQLNKCFIIVTEFDTTGYTKELVDTFEGKQYANIHVFTDKNLPSLCGFYLPSALQKCVEADFGNYTKTYMEN